MQFALWSLVIDVVVLWLATYQIVDVYRNSDLTANLRERWDEKTGFWFEMQACSYCLTHWVAGALCLLALAGHTAIADSHRSMLLFQLCFLLPKLFAVARLATWGHDKNEWGWQQPSEGDPYDEAT